MMETQIIVSGVVFGVVVLAAVIGSLPFVVYMERKVAAYMQDRIGPNRVGPRGLLQCFADGVKVLFKEDYNPAGVDKPLFILGPALAMASALATLAVIPFGGVMRVSWLSQPTAIQIAPGLDVGVLYIVLVATGTVYAVILGGWGSNNKFAFYGAMRSASQLLSYETPLGLALLAVVMLAGDLRPEMIVARQVEDGWFVLYVPGLFLVMLIAMFAETNRLPFDLPESEQELVGGYHTEYSSLKFAFFYLGEYAHVIGSAALLVTLFFGGWHLPGLTPAVEGGLGQTISKLVVFAGKITAVLFFFMWVRWTLPRFRFDQLLRFAWTQLLPGAISMFTVAAVMIYLGLGSTVWMPLANVAVLIAAYMWTYVREVRAVSEG